MKKTSKFTLAVLAAVMALSSAMGQTSGSNSPFSRYGWGTLADESMGFNKGMAGLAVAMHDSLSINRQNPAAYSGICAQTLIFDAGISLQNCQLKSGGKTVNARNSSVDYIAAGFRLAPGVGLSLGLRPFSYVGYNFSTSKPLDDIDGYGSKTTSSSYYGDGGFRQAYIGVGYRPVLPLSVGMNINYIWGDYQHSSTVSYSDATVQSLTRNYKATINAPTVDFGAQYKYKLDEKNSFTLGVTYGLGCKINQQAKFVNTQSGTNSSNTPDTMRVGKAFALPDKVAVGLTWNRGNNLVVGADYSVEFWEKCRFPWLRGSSGLAVYEVGKGHLRNRHKVTVGAEYVPNPRGYKIKDHIAYRAGMSYSSPYTKTGHGNDGPEYYLVSAGVALPIVNKYSTRSVLNISAQWEHAASRDLKALKEDYLRLCIGLTFNATWFNKWKFE